MLNTSLSDKIARLAEVETPEPAALVYVPPVLNQIIQTNAQQRELLGAMEERQDSERDLQAEEELRAAIQESQGLVDQMSTQVRWRHPRAQEAETLRKAAELASREFLGNENKATLLANLDLFTDEELVETILESMGKSEAWANDQSLMTPRGALYGCAERIRAALEPVTHLLDDELAGSLVGVLAHLEITGDMADPQAYLADLEVNIQDPEGVQIANADDPRAMEEQITAAHLRFELERRQVERAELLSEWSAKPREVLLQRALKGFVDAQRAGASHRAYIRHRVVNGALVRDPDGTWRQCFGTIEDLEAAENHDDERTRAHMQDFIAWLCRAMEDRCAVEQQVGRVVASRQFPGHLEPL